MMMMMNDWHYLPLPQPSARHQLTLRDQRLVDGMVCCMLPSFHWYSVPQKNGQAELTRVVD